MSKSLTSEPTLSNTTKTEKKNTPPASLWQKVWNKCTQMFNYEQNLLLARTVSDGRVPGEKTSKLTIILT